MRSLSTKKMSRILSYWNFGIGIALATSGVIKEDPLSAVIGAIVLFIGSIGLAERN